jgi:acetylglutamate kinase
VAKILAISLQHYFDVQLVFGFGLPGVLRDIAQAASKIDSLHLDEIAVMKNQGIFSGGMLPKIESAVEAVIQGVAQVRIADLKQLNQLEYNPNYGTRICH